MALLSTYSRCSRQPRHIFIRDLGCSRPDFQYNGPNCKQSPAAYYFFAGFLYQSRCNTPLDDTQPGKLG